MTKFSVVVLPITVLMVLCSWLYFFNYSQDYRVSFEQKRLDAIVNYAVDAAVDEMVLNTADLGMDYTDWEKLKVEPSVALDTFTTVFLKGYGMSYSKENIQMVKNDFTSCFIVAMYDGYYVGKPTEINSSGARDVVFSPKWPYLYVDASGFPFALNMSKEDCKVYDNTAGMVRKVSTVGVIDKTEQNRIINSKISDALMDTVFKGTERGSMKTPLIPTNVTTLKATNPITNVSVLAYMDNVELGPSLSLNTFAIGGASITKQDFVGGYIKDGKRYYAYLKNIPNGVFILEVFETPELAAKSGYQFDPIYLD